MGGSRERRVRWLALALPPVLGAAALAAALLMRGSEERAESGAEPTAERVPGGGDQTPPPGAATVAAGSVEGSLPPPPAAAERILVAPGLRGRVVDGRTGLPVAEVEAQYWFAGGLKAEARSGPDGVFLFTLDIPAMGTMKPSKAGWRFDPASLRMRDLRPGEEIVFQGTPIHGAPVRGRLVDEDTGEPVPSYRIELSGKGDRVETLVTDDEGRFASQGDFEPGEVSVRLTEFHLWSERKLEHRVEDPAPEPEDLPIPVGPTIFFELEEPERHGDLSLTAELLDQGVPLTRQWAMALAQGWNGWDGGDFEPPSEAAFHGHPCGISADVRFGQGVAWVRFPPFHFGPKPGPTGYPVLVSDRERGWGGVAFTPGLRGKQEIPLRIRLERMVALTGIVSSAPQVPVRALVVLRGGSLAFPLECINDEEGGFSFFATAGEYDLTVEGLGASLAQSVSLVDRNVHLDLHLDGPKTLEISGIMRVPSGTFEADPLCELRSTTDPKVRFLAQAEFRKKVDRKHDFVRTRMLKEDDGSIVAPFSFQAVPAGSYELLAPTHAGFAWRPSRFLVEGSRADLELVYRDDGPKTALCFEVLDDGGNAVDANVGGRIQGDSAELACRQGVMEVATGSTVHWVAFADGYVPAQGVCRAEAPDRQVITVNLEAGSGVFVETIDPFGDGVADVEVLVDGLSTGRTNALGFATLALEGTEHSIAGRKPGWVCADVMSELDVGHAVLYLAAED